MHQVYIIYSKSTDRYYVGSTGAGVGLRLERHNQGWTRSTKAGAPWELKFLSSFESKSQALRREKFIKKQKSREFLDRLINSDENEFSR